MKFGKQLEDDWVPEWQLHYLNYKAGKKRISAVNKAKNNVPKTLSDRNQERLDQYESEIDLRKAEFFQWLDHELERINKFYQEKENLSKERLERIQEQFSIMHSQHKLDLPPRPESVLPPHQFDYIRRPDNQVSLTNARRTLKRAVMEEYRHLQFLKHYMTLNHTGFRKILKKYVKKTKPQQAVTYMQDKVDKAYFVTSDETDHLMKAYEDLYARHYENGNTKLAASKLRGKTKPTIWFRPTFLSGLLLGTGSALGILGLVAAILELYNGDLNQWTNANYGLQIFGGFFIILVMAFGFVIDCHVFNHFQVNYRFIFELDPKTALSWYELLEIPSWLFFFLGLTIFLDYGIYTGDDLFHYWPLLTTALWFLFFINPFVPYRAARWWLIKSLWRCVKQLIWPKHVGVEFRDFFIGDLLCSLTYAFANIWVFPCLLATNWKDPGHCGSSDRKFGWAVGAMTLLPALDRAAQCLRRMRASPTEVQAYYQLANTVKYGFTAAMYASLMAYRIEKDLPTQVVFGTISTVNSLYCIFWDIKVDWSLFQEGSKFWGLRTLLVYGRKRRYIYYGAMVIDIILRFNWIPYLIWTTDTQHASVVSFVVALSEVLRRCMWAVFRVENEHITNIQQGKAIKDKRLPYKISESPLEQAQLDSTTGQPDEDWDSESQSPRKRLKRTFSHQNDYERRWTPDDIERMESVDYDDSDDED